MDGRSLMCECHADTLTVMRLMRLNYVNHMGNAQEVMKGFDKKSYKNGTAIGVIDLDKRLPPGFKQFKEVQLENGVLLLQKPAMNHFLITIDPAIEKFLLDSALDANIDPGKYKIPDTVKKLKRITKSLHLNQNDDFKQFLNTLIQKNPDNFKGLKKQILKAYNKS